MKTVLLFNLLICSCILPADLCFIPRRIPTPYKNPRSTDMRDPIQQRFAALASPHQIPPTKDSPFYAREFPCLPMNDRARQMNNQARQRQQKKILIRIADCNAAMSNMTLFIKWYENDPSEKERVKHWKTRISALTGERDDALQLYRELEQS